MKLYIKLFLAGMFVINLLSCTKDEGVGGNATIRGKVIVRNYNDDFSILLSEHSASEEDVYIIYGNDKTFGDQVETNYDGTFEFNYLLPGDYSVFIYSEDTSSNLLYDTVAVKNITISKKDDVVEAGTLAKINILDFDEGNSSISGRVYLVNYDKSTICTQYPVSDTSYAQEQEVYIVYGSHEYYDDRIRTHYDGTFKFDNLIKGIYKVYTYSEDITGATQMIPVIRQVEITAENQDIVVNDIYIEKI